MFPDGRPMDGGDEGAQREVANVDQRRVQAGHGAIVNGIESALRAAIAAAMLVMALVRGNKRQIGNSAGSEVVIEPAAAFKADDVRQTVAGIIPLLHALEIDKRIVFRGIEFEQAADGGGRGIDIGEIAIAVINAVRSGGRQAFLVALPTAMILHELVS